MKCNVSHVSGLVAVWHSQNEKLQTVCVFFSSFWNHNCEYTHIKFSSFLRAFIRANARAHMPWLFAPLYPINLRQHVISFGNKTKTHKEKWWNKKYTKQRCKYCIKYVAADADADDDDDDVENTNVRTNLEIITMLSDNMSNCLRDYLCMFGVCVCCFTCVWQFGHFSSLSPSLLLSFSLSFSPHFTFDGISCLICCCYCGSRCVCVGVMFTFVWALAHQFNSKVPRGAFFFLLKKK